MGGLKNYYYNEVTWNDISKALTVRVQRSSRSMLTYHQMLLLYLFVLRLVMDYIYT